MLSSTLRSISDAVSAKIFSHPIEGTPEQSDVDAEPWDAVAEFPDPYADVVEEETWVVVPDPEEAPASEDASSDLYESCCSDLKVDVDRDIFVSPRAFEKHDINVFADPHEWRSARDREPIFFM